MTRRQPGSRPRESSRGLCLLFFFSSLPRFRTVSPRARLPSAETATPPPESGRCPPASPARAPPPARPPERAWSRCRRPARRAFSRSLGGRRGLGPGRRARRCGGLPSPRRARWAPGLAGPSAAPSRPAAANRLRGPPLPLRISRPLPLRCGRTDAATGARAPRPAPFGVDGWGFLSVSPSPSAPPD